jgi:hypothetical protein
MKGSGALENVSAPSESFANEVAKETHSAIFSSELSPQQRGLQSEEIGNSNTVKKRKRGRPPKASRFVNHHSSPDLINSPDGMIVGKEPRDGRSNAIYDSQGLLQDQRPGFSSHSPSDGEVRYELKEHQRDEIGGIYDFHIGTPFTVSTPDQLSLIIPDSSLFTSMDSIDGSFTRVKVAPFRNKPEYETQNTMAKKPFITFYASVRHEIQAQKPDLRHKQVVLMVKDMWAAMSEDEKRFYYNAKDPRERVQFMDITGIVSSRHKK